MGQQGAGTVHQIIIICIIVSTKRHHLADEPHPLLDATCRCRIQRERMARRRKPMPVEYRNEAQKKMPLTCAK